MTTFADYDGNELEYNGKDFNLTKQSISFRSFTIKGDVSINIKIPNTAKNRALLGYEGPQQLNGGSAFSRIPFIVRRNGTNVYNGFIVIQTDDGENLGAYFISGNSNWFKSFQFYCNEVVNPDYSIQWIVGDTTSSAATNRNNLHGIFFPFIDFVTKGYRAESRFATTLQYDPTTNSEKTIEDKNSARFTDLYPCLYVHTLVQEIAKLADVRIKGTLLDDKIYNAAFITPESSELTDPQTGERIYFGLYFNASLITIGAIAPKIKAIDLIKWICFTFGCIPNYDVTSNTLYLNIAKNFKKEEAENWSDYVKSYEVNFKDVSQKYLISNKQPDEDEIKEYNTGKEVEYGNALIETNSDDNKTVTLYQSPFNATKDQYRNDSKFLWATPAIEFFEFEPVETVTYTSVILNSGFVQFLGPTVTFVPSEYFVALIEDDNGIYNGYSFFTTGTAPARFSCLGMDFKGTSTGKITTQKLSPKTAGHRVLIAMNKIGGILSNLFTNPASASGLNYDGYGTVLSMTPAYFSKPTTIYSEVNAYKNGLAYGSIDLTGYNDDPMEENYLRPVKAMIKSAPIRAKALLPESVFYNYNFDKWIYVNTGSINGYFYVPKIEFYQGADEEVTIEMHQLDL